MLRSVAIAPFLSKLDAVRRAVALPTPISSMRKRFTRKPDFCCEHLQHAETQRRLRMHQVDEILAGKKTKFRPLRRLRCQGVWFCPNHGRHAKQRAGAHACGQHLLALRASGQRSRPLGQNENADWSIALTEENTIRAKAYWPRSLLQCPDQFVIGNKCG